MSGRGLNCETMQTEDATDVDSDLRDSLNHSRETSDLPPMTPPTTMETTTTTTTMNESLLRASVNGAPVSSHEENFDLVDRDDFEDEDISADTCCSHFQSSTHIHPRHCHQPLDSQRHFHQYQNGGELDNHQHRRLYGVGGSVGLRGLDFEDVVGEGIGGSGSFSGGSDVGTSSKSKKRPVIHYLPSAGGVKKLGLASVASESVVTGPDMRRGHLIEVTGKSQARPHKPGVMYQVASDYILERNLGFDLSHKPIALHEVASETAMALKTGHCKLHRECSLQGPSWQNLCIQQQSQLDGYGKDNELATYGLPLGSKTPSFTYAATHEGKGVVPVSSNTTVDAMTGSMVSVSLFPFCRICHMAASDSDEPLISPCRCSGTMQYIHGSCLMKWMDICSRKSRRTQRCELCHYQYSRQKRFQFKEWKMPRSSRRDKLLHAIFLLNLIVMVGCAVATVYCFLSDTGMSRRSHYQTNYVNQGSSSTQGIFMVGGGVGSNGGNGGGSSGVGVGESDGTMGENEKDKIHSGKDVEVTLTADDVVVRTSNNEDGDGGGSDSTESADPRFRGRVDLTSEEVVTLCCGVLFFISFFVAMYAQIKAKHTLYQLFVRFTVLNTKWEIEEYNPANDPLLLSLPQKQGLESNPSPVMV